MIAAVENSGGEYAGSLGLGVGASPVGEESPCQTLGVRDLRSASYFAFSSGAKRTAAPAAPATSSSTRMTVPAPEDSSPTYAIRSATAYSCR